MPIIHHPHTPTFCKVPSAVRSDTSWTTPVCVCVSVFSIKPSLNSLTCRPPSVSHMNYNSHNPFDNFTAELNTHTHANQSAVINKSTHPTSTQENICYVIVVLLLYRLWNRNLTSREINKVINRYCSLSVIG